MKSEFSRISSTVCVQNIDLDTVMEEGHSVIEFYFSLKPIHSNTFLIHILTLIANFHLSSNVTRSLAYIKIVSNSKWHC